VVAGSNGQPAHVLNLVFPKKRFAEHWAGEDLPAELDVEPVPLFDLVVALAHCLDRHVQLVDGDLRQGSLAAGWISIDAQNGGFTEVPGDVLQVVVPAEAYDELPVAELGRLEAAARDKLFWSEDRGDDTLPLPLQIVAGLDVVDLRLRISGSLVKLEQLEWGEPQSPAVVVDFGVFDDGRDFGLIDRSQVDVAVQPVDPLAPLDDRNRARIQDAAFCLREAAGDKAYGVLQLVLASCACAVSRSWKQSMIQAGECAVGFLADKYGPSSACAIELQCQAMDLWEIAGCRLRDVLSLEHDDIEELEGFLELEDESESAERSGKAAKPDSQLGRNAHEETES